MSLTSESHHQQQLHRTLFFFFFLFPTDEMIKNAEQYAAIDQYDGLAIRSATKVNEKLIEKAGKLKVIGRAGIGVDNVEIPAASGAGIVVMNTPFGNAITSKA